MKQLTGFFVVFILAISTAYSQVNYTITGSVTDSTGAAVIGAIVQVKGNPMGAATDADGNFTITMPAGTYTLVISYFGYTQQEKVIELNKNTFLNVVMAEDQMKTAEIVISDKAPNANVTDTKMGASELTVEEIKNLPALFGEVDIVKNIQTLPGVQVAGDGNTGLYVRGGGADQNLILMDEAPVYNASHLLGLFSVFNADAVKAAELYKAGIPSQYGGRLSSLLDVKSRTGNTKKFGGSAGIGTISSRLALEGPFAKGKGSYIIAGRRSYADLFLLLAKDPDLRKTQLHFYDLNGKVNYQFNKNNSIYISSYYGRDVMKLSDLFSQRWGNYTLTVNYQHNFSDKVFLNTIFAHSDYKYILGINSGVQAFDFTTGISENSLKQDYRVYPGARHDMHIGWSVAQRTYNPGKFAPSTDNSIFKEIKLPNNHSIEGALFISNKQKISEKLTLDYGLRLNVFSNVGAGQVFSYNGDPVNGQITDTTTYAKGEAIKTYMGLEPRLAARFMIDEESSIKAGYNRNIQYIHQISNSLSPVPFDVWMPSNTYFKPEFVDQYSAGYFRNLSDNMYETSVELYYKNYRNSIDFIDNADLLLNPAIETQVKFGKAWSYGAEFFLKKKQGKLTGWISYTLSYSYKQIPGINNGEKYFAGYDRRHNLNVVASYKANERWTLSASFVFGTGRPIGLPSGGYSITTGSDGSVNGNYDGSIWLGVYPERNSFRLPSYHRLDLSATLKCKKKAFGVFDASWNFSIYNTYGMFHINPYTIVTRTNQDNPNQRDYYAIYFPAPIPSITYNVTF